MDTLSPKYNILVNKVQCLQCGDIIESKYRHDFVTCKCGSISVDGGKDYLRRVGNLSKETYKDLSESEESVN